MMTSCPAGVLLVGHGTRDPVGAEQFLAAARMMRSAMLDRLVEPCFLEIRRPDMAEAFEHLVKRGARQVAVMPLLLLAAGHARRDIPAIVARLADEHPGITISQCPHLGCHEAIAKLSARRYQETLAGRADVAAEKTLLLLVARGTSDETAITEMQDFARRRAARLPVGRVEACFAAVAEPTLEAALERVATLSYARIVIQPHLLFRGLVLDGIKGVVATFAERYPGREWLLTQPLDVTTDVAQAVAQIVQGVQGPPVNSLAAASIEQ